MARSTIKRRQQADRESIAAYEATLRRVSAKARSTPDFKKALRQAARGFEADAVRDAAAWRPKLKTRDEARLRLAAARHLFARYPVPSPLDRIWLDSEGLPSNEIRFRKRWYVVVAGGGSLFKAEASRWLTRKEAHWFLNPPGDLSFEEAFWQAVTRSYTEDMGIALRIARSKVARTPRQEIGFWREVARFFAVNPTQLEEIGDLCDFLTERRQREPGYSLKGRTLGSLRRQMHEWHRDTETVARIEAARRRAEASAIRNGHGAAQGGRWKGSSLSDWFWRPSINGGGKQTESVSIVQLRKAEDLVFESRVMRHCVWTYASKCIAGRSSIWSLRRHQNGEFDHLLTIELDDRNRAIQVRGLANRVARPDERKLLERWAKSRGVTLQC